MEIKNIIFKSIREKGHLTISQFMEIILTSYEGSYYRAKNPLDQDGDFITAPEVSQMFGEMVGVWVYKQWLILGKPEKINIVEFGPGRGLLMRDLLRVILKTEMKNHISVFLYDVNEALIKVQKEILSSFPEVKWIEHITDLEQKTTIFIANEFFDALPITQYIKVKENWHEVVLRTNPAGNTIIFDKFEVEEHIDEYLSFEYRNAKDGAIVEESKIAADYVRFLARNIKEFNSVALILDYGYDLEPNERKSSQYFSTLQGIKKHKYTPILHDIGNTDISSHVDFNRIKKIASNLDVKSISVVTQREFLLEQGIVQRLEDLAAKNPELTNLLYSQYNRLVSDNEMGRLFKALVMSDLE